MNENSLLEVLKFLLIVYGVVKHLRDWKKEKTLIETLDKYNQRLEKLEKIVKTLKP